MKRNSMRFFIGILCLLFIAPALLYAKPDKIDGENYPLGRIPQEIKNNKYPRTYFPSTEKLGKDEMRIVALGTGMPNQSPSNVAACFLVELGNGGSFLFDMGTGSSDRLAGLEADYSKLDKVLSDTVRAREIAYTENSWPVEGAWPRSQQTPNRQVHTDERVCQGGARFLPGYDQSARRLQTLAWCSYSRSEM